MAPAAPLTSLPGGTGGRFEGRRAGAMAGGRGPPRRARSAGEARAGAASPPLRRRSERNVASPAAQPTSQRKPRLGASKAVGSLYPAPLAMRPITLKKIVPRSRQIKETTVAPRRSPRISLKEDKENVPTRATEVKSPGGGDARTKLEPFPLHCSSLEPAAGDPQGGTAALSPVNVNMQDSPSGDQRDLAMAKRVRRSYSRLEISLAHTLESSRSPGSSLADTSTPDHSLDKRRTLFGFEKLLLSDEVPGVSPVNASAPQKVAETVGEPDVLQDLDTDIPGIAFCKEKRRKKKMPQFDKSELDQWAAQMNAEFEAAERFSLHVE